MLRVLTETFERFVRSEQSSSILLIVCTVLALSLANSSFGPAYASMWQLHVAGMSLEHWVNDALMALFFLLIGLELERELYVGELSEPRKALLPVFAALGGMLAPALIHFAFNAGTSTQNGFGIPMATDIAFALGVLALLGNRVPAALKVFVVAFAVIDDLGAVIIIALFYTAQFSVPYLTGAMAVWLVLVGLNRYFGVMSLTPYLIGGALMWFLMLKSGVHSTIAGVLLAFAIPFRSKNGISASHTLEHALHRPAAFIILPLFALANARILVDSGWLDQLMDANSAGIAGGLIVGKPVGVVTACLLATWIGLCKLPAELKWTHLLGAGMLGGVGFTMSIFITNLAFTDAGTVNAAKMAILAASLTSGLIGYLWLRCFSRPVA